MNPTPASAKVGPAAVTSLTESDVLQLAGDIADVRTLHGGMTVSGHDDGMALSVEAPVVERPLLLHDTHLYTLTFVVPGYALPFLFHHHPSLPIYDFPAIVLAAQGSLVDYHQRVRDDLVLIAENLGRSLGNVRTTATGVHEPPVRRSRSASADRRATLDADTGLYTLSEDQVPLLREVYPGQVTGEIAQVWRKEGLEGLWPFLADLPVPLAPVPKDEADDTSAGD